MDLALMQTAPTGTSLPRLAERMWERLGADSVTVFEGDRSSSAELGERARRLAGGLWRLGVRPGDRVVVCMANCPEVPISYHAVWRIGAVVTPVLFLLTEDELRHVITDSGAVAVITTPEFTAKLRAAGAPVVVVAGEESYAELERSEEADLVDPDPGTPCALLYTGGTTGRSKGVVLSHDALSASAWSAVASGPGPELTVGINPLPLAHAYGLMVSTMALHAVEPTTSVLMRWFDAAGWLRLVQQERVQTGAMVPTMLRLLLDQPLHEYDLSSLRRLSSGSAPLPAGLRARFDQALPWVEIGEGYGCTETAALVSAQPYGANRPGSVGKPVTGVEVRIEPDTGEICVRGPNLMSGYWNSPETTAFALRDGWFHTGDVGRLDEDGYLYIVDRIKDVIIRGGFNVYPRDVEEVLVAHPAVGSAAVVGRPDPEHGEEVVAFVQLRPGASVSPEQLIAHAKQHLSAVKYPREVHLLDQVPVTSIGKIDRKALRAQLA